MGDRASYTEVEVAHPVVDLELLLAALCLFVVMIVATCTGWLGVALICAVLCYWAVDRAMP